MGVCVRILAGMGESYQDNTLNLFSYFASTCYDGFDDGEKVCVFYQRTPVFLFPIDIFFFLPTWGSHFVRYFSGGMPKCL